MATKKRKNKLNSLIAPLETSKQVNREVNAAARIRQRPVAREIRGAVRESNQQSANIGSWHRQHQQQISAIQAGGARRQDATNEQALRQSEMAGTQDSANRKEMQAGENQSASYRGVTPDSSAAARGVEAAAQRSNLRSISADRASQIGQTNNNLLGQISAASTIGRNAMLRGERAVRENAGQDRRKLAQDTADFKVDYRGKLRGGERDFYLQRRTLAGKDNYADAMKYVADKGLAGKQASAGATIAAARLYSGAKIQSAKIYGKGQNGKAVSGKDILRADGYLRATVAKAESNWRDVWNNQGKMVANLVDRGSDPVAARIAVKRYVTTQRKKWKSDKAKNKVGSPAWKNERDKRSGRK